jgi:hypothetical protein
MDSKRKLRPVARLLEALEAEEIQFMLIGMSAAVIQGVMETTLDVDLWINLPPRQYMRVQKVVRHVRGVVAANTVAYLEDGTPVNFIFEVDGLHSFERELKNTEQLKFHGKVIPVLKLVRILKSKETVARDKDLPHIIHIRNLLRCRRAVSVKPKKKPSSGKSKRT